MGKNDDKSEHAAPPAKAYADFSAVRHHDDAYRLTNLGLASPEQIAIWRKPTEEGGKGLLAPLPEVA